MHVLVVERVRVDPAAGEGDHRLHFLLERGRRPADDDSVRGERVRPVELALEPGDVRLHVHDLAVRPLPCLGQRAGLRLVERDAADDPPGQVVAADTVLDQVAGHRRWLVPAPGHRAARELGVRRVLRPGHQDAVGQHGLPGGDGVVEVVRRLGAGVVVERHPVLGADRLGGDEAAVAAGLVGAEPALGGAVTVGVHARPAGVVDSDGEVRPAGDRRGRRDHQLVGRALLAVLGVPFREAGGFQLRRAGGRQRIVPGAADRGVLGGLVRERVRVVLAVRVARVGGLDERERRGRAVHGDRVDGHVRADGHVRRRLPLEVEAEGGQALGGPVGQHDVVARQELVGGGVVNQVHAGVQARVAAVAGVRVDVIGETGQRVRAGEASAACRCATAGLGTPAGDGPARGAGQRGRAQAQAGQQERERDGDGGARAVPGHDRRSLSGLTVTRPRGADGGAVPGSSLLRRK